MSLERNWREPEEMTLSRSYAIKGKRHEVIAEE